MRLIIHQIDNMTLEQQVDDLVKNQPNPAHKKAIIMDDVRRVQEKFHNPVTQKYLVEKKWGFEIDNDYADFDSGNGPKE